MVSRYLAVRVGETNPSTIWNLPPSQTPSSVVVRFTWAPRPDCTEAASDDNCRTRNVFPSPCGDTKTTCPFLSPAEAEDSAAPAERLLYCSPVSNVGIVTPFSGEKSSAL